MKWKMMEIEKVENENPVYSVPWIKKFCKSGGYCTD